MKKKQIRKMKTLKKPVFASLLFASLLLFLLIEISEFVSGGVTLDDVNITPNSTYELTYTNFSIYVYNREDPDPIVNHSVCKFKIIASNVITTDTGWIYNSTVNGTFYVSQSTGIFANINDTIIQTGSNVSSQNPAEFATEVYIIGSIITNSTIIDLAGDNYAGYDVYIVNCTIINSTKIEPWCENSYIANSFDPRSNTTGSYVINTTYDSSNITYSNVSDSYINWSSINNSNVDDSNIQNSSANNANISNVTMIYSIVNDSTISDSELINSNITGSEITNSDLTNSSIANSTVTDSTLNNSTISDSTIDNSTLTDSIINNSVITDSNLTNSNVADSNLTNVIATNSSITNSTLENATLIDANLTDNILYNGTIIIGNSTYNATNNLPLNISNQSAWPRVTLTISPGPYYTGRAITFTATISGQFDTNTTITYKWDWTNDGTIDYTADNISTASHTYTTPGNYAVKVIVSDQHGTSSYAIISFLVRSEPVEEEEEDEEDEYEPGAAAPITICGNRVCEPNESITCPQDCITRLNITNITNQTKPPKIIEIRSDDELVIFKIDSDTTIKDENDMVVDISKIKIEKITDIKLLPISPQIEGVYLIRAYKVSPSMFANKSFEIIMKYNKEELIENASLFIYKYLDGWKKQEAFWDKDKQQLTTLTDSVSIIGLFTDKVPAIPKTSLTGAIVGFVKANWDIIVIGLLGLIVVIFAIILIVRKIKK